MRRGGALLLLVALFAVTAVAKDSVDTLPAETNGDGTNAHSSSENLGQPDDTNPQKELATHGNGGSKNDVGEDDNKDKPTVATRTTIDEPKQQPRDNDSTATKLPQVRDFSQYPLIKDCDPSHRCIIAKKNFIACLKVPGEGGLSLLMDNKGMDPLDVSVTAPDDVTLAEDTVHVEADGHTEVSFSISDAANDTAVVLKVAEDSCTINIHSHSAVTRETGQIERMPLVSTYTLVPVFLLLVVVGVFVKLQRARKQDSGPAYHKLDTAELPVSVGGKKEPGQTDKWDNNWGDDWDDEEAPMTPSRPVTNPSSKGLAPRKSAKDSWKD